MAKLNDYMGSVPVAGGLKSKGTKDFALMEAHSIAVGEGDERLDDFIDQIVEAFETMGDAQTVKNRLDNLEGALGSYITEIDNLVGGGL